MSALHKPIPQPRFQEAAPEAPAATLYLVSPSDASLVTAAMTGAEGAFEGLVARHRNTALRVAASIVGFDRAEDVVQDALLLAYWSLPSLRERGKFVLWLTAITRDLAVRLGDADTQRLRNHVSLDSPSLETAPELASAPRFFDERGRPVS